MLGSAPLLVSSTSSDLISTPILVAVVALLGTVIGAVIGAATNYVLAVRRERADREREKSNRLLEVRRGARLIDSELSRADAVLRVCIDTKRWWPEKIQISSLAWQKHIDSIAPDPSNLEWQAALKAHDAVFFIVAMRDIAFSHGVPKNEIAKEIVDNLLQRLEEIQNGRRALKPFSYPES